MMDRGLISARGAAIGLVDAPSQHRPLEKSLYGRLNASPSSSRAAA